MLFPREQMLFWLHSTGVHYANTRKQNRLVGGRAIRGRYSRGPVGAGLAASGGSGRGRLGVHPPNATGDASTHLIAPVGAPNYRAIVAENQAAVVGITTAGETKVANMQPRGFGGPFDGNDDPLFQFFRGMPMPKGPHTMHAQGSGFLVSSDGIVLTNAHVIDGAKVVTVKLSDHREFKAKVLGADTRSDIAVLKIDAHNLPTVRVGNSDQLGVGDYVLAIGEPFGLEETATAGIVSATARSLPGDGYVPFIQTDAAVNPGNSGGPLFDSNGRVVGINAQIYTNSGGYEGVSFAIPINVALHVEDQIVKTGKVAHARLGVEVQTLDQSLADSFKLTHAERCAGREGGAGQRGGASGRPGRRRDPQAERRSDQRCRSVVGEDR